MGVDKSLSLGQRLAQSVDIPSSAQSNRCKLHPTSVDDYIIKSSDRPPSPPDSSNNAHQIPINESPIRSVDALPLAYNIGSGLSRTPSSLLPSRATSYNQELYMEDKLNMGYLPVPTSALYHETDNDVNPSSSNREKISSHVGSIGNNVSVVALPHPESKEFLTENSFDIKGKVKKIKTKKKKRVVPADIDNGKGDESHHKTHVKTKEKSKKYKKHKGSKEIGAVTEVIVL